MKGYLKWIFLPEGYPSSVSKDYLSFQFWDTLSGFFGYLKGVILNMCFLNLIGVGNQSTSIYDAIYILIYKDLANIISGLIIGIPYLTKSFSDPNKILSWSLKAELLRFLTGIIEVYNIIANKNYFSIMILNVVLNTAAGIITKQTRSNLVTHFAISNNYSDCAAKESNQDRGIKFVGLPIAIYFVKFIKENQNKFLFCFIIFSLGQFYSIYKSIKCLKFKK